MSQERIDGILNNNYMRPDLNEVSYKQFKIKMDYLINHLLTEIINLNTFSFINTKTMDGLKIYKKLVDVLHGQDQNENR